MDVQGYNGTAWWGWCADCGVPFGSHNIGCPQMAAFRFNAAAASPIKLTWTAPHTAAAAAPVPTVVYFDTAGGQR